MHLLNVNVVDISSVVKRIGIYIFVNNVEDGTIYEIIKTNLLLTSLFFKSQRNINKVISMEKIMIDEGLDRALDVIRTRIEYYKKEDSLVNNMIIKELELLVKKIENQRYYK